MQLLIDSVLKFTVYNYARNYDSFSHDGKTKLGGFSTATCHSKIFLSRTYSILKKNPNGFSFKKPPIHIAGNCVGLLTQI